MALQDILNAISAEADRQIGDARTRHQQTVTGMREQSERVIARKKQQIASQRDEKKAQMLAKLQTHAVMLRRNAILQKKQELLDRTYERVLESLTSLSGEKEERLLRSCLKVIGEKGAIHPTAKHASVLATLAPSEQFTIGKTIPGSGGFRFVSDKKEYDFTYEQLISSVLRPRTELTVSHSLFQ